MFLHDTRTRKTTLISRMADGTSGALASGPASLSANGRYVSFLSYSGGLASGDRVNVSEAYLHDTVSGSTELVSLGTDNAARSALTSTSVSADGRRVLFESLDADVTPDADNRDQDVFLRDRIAGTTTRVAGHQDGASRSSISADGRVAVYQSGDHDIVPGDTNNKTDVFVVHLDTLTHTLVSKSSAGVVGNDESKCAGVSSDGRYVTFESHASNLVGGDTNAQADVFRHDLATGTTIRVGVHPNAAQSTSASVTRRSAGTASTWCSSPTRAI